MATRYEDVTENVKELAGTVIDEYFPELRNVKINYVFDLKKKTEMGRVVVGRCQKTNEVLKFFTINEANDEDGYQYIIFLDKCSWDAVTEPDRVRILRHQYRHIFIDNDAKQPFKLVPHDVSDFYEEIELNRDDPRWEERISSLAESIYSQRDDQESNEE